MTGSHDAIVVAKSLIEKVIATESEKAAARSGPGAGGNSDNVSSYEMMIPGKTGCPRNMSFWFN